jgi:hypothetical protein
MVKARNYSAKISYTIAIAVLVRSGIDLINYFLLPPQMVFFTLFHFYSNPPILKKPVPDREIKRLFLSGSEKKGARLFYHILLLQIKKLISVYLTLSFLSLAF